MAGGAYALGLVAGLGLDIRQAHQPAHGGGANLRFTHQEESDAALPRRPVVGRPHLTRITEDTAPSPACATPARLRTAAPVSANGRELTRSGRMALLQSWSFHRGLAVAVSLLVWSSLIGAAIVWHSRWSFWWRGRGGLPVADLPAGCEAHAFPANFENDPKHIHASTADESVNEDGPFRGEVGVACRMSVSAVPSRPASR